MHPVATAVGKGAADHLFGIAAIVSIGGVNKIDAGLARFCHDPRRGRLVGRAAEHHGAQANRRNFQAAAAEVAVLHRVGPPSWYAPSPRTSRGKGWGEGLLPQIPKTIVAATP